MDKRNKIPLSSAAQREIEQAQADLNYREREMSEQERKLIEREIQLEARENHERVRRAAAEYAQNQQDCRSDWSYGDREGFQGHLGRRQNPSLESNYGEPAGTFYGHYSGPQEPYNGMYPVTSVRHGQASCSELSPGM